MEVNRRRLEGKIRYSVGRRNRYSWNPTRSVFNKGESRSARSVIEYCGAARRFVEEYTESRRGGALAGIADQHVNWCAGPRNNTRPPCLFKTDPHSSRRIKGVSGVLHRPRNTLLAGQRPRLCLKFRPRDPMTERNSIKFMYTRIRTGVDSRRPWDMWDLDLDICISSVSKYSYLSLIHSSSLSLCFTAASNWNCIRLHRFVAPYRLALPTPACFTSMECVCLCLNMQLII